MGRPPRFGRWVSAEGRWHVVAMAVVLLVSFVVRLDHISLALPYPRHLDEGTWVKISYRMLQTGKANPERFNYPSLPVYLMTAGFSVGLLGAKLSGNAHSARDFGRDVDDFYQLPGAALLAKSLFALASVVAMGAAGFVGYAFSLRREMLWLTPLLAAISASYFKRSWLYMNVDILGAGFAWVTLGYLFYEHTRGKSFASGSGSFRRLVILGVLSGLTVGCKYNLFPILFPGALWFLLFDRRRWYLHVAALGLVAVAAFFLTTPYALVTPREFVAALAHEAHHYANGHRGRTGTPGLPMLWQHVRRFGEDFGWLPYLVSVAGAVLLVFRDKKLAALLFVWPVGFVCYMSLQRVFFERNDAAIIPLIALTLAFALLELPRRALETAAKLRPALAARLPPRALTMGLALLVVLGIPWGGVALAYSRRVEPRNEAIQWLRREGNANARLLIDADLGLDFRPLEGTMRMRVLDPRRNAKEAAALLADESPLLVVTTEERADYFVKKETSLRVKARFVRADGRANAVILGR